MVTITPVELISNTFKNQSCYSFIGVPAQSKGKFIPEKAKELGCNPRVHYKLLHEGHNVTLDDGTIVYPFQVMEDQLPSQCFILMFIPSKIFLASLFDKQAFSKFQPYFFDMIDKKINEMSVMYHSIPLNCLLNENYKQFMMSFGPKVKHIIDCHETNDEVMNRAKSYNINKRHS
jgi:ribonuclease Z